MSVCLGTVTDFQSASALEVQADKLFAAQQESSLKPILGKASSSKVHYRFSHFSLSPGFMAHHSMALQNDNSRGPWTPQSCTDRVVCNAHDHPYATLLPHFGQLAFPCWSALQRFNATVQRVMLVPGSLLTGTDGQWAHQLVRVFQSGGITVVDSNNWRSSPQKSLCEWTIVRQREHHDGTEISSDGWPMYHYNHGESSPIGNAKYFETAKDMTRLQQLVLRHQFLPTQNRSNQMLNVLLYERKGDTRQWIYARETIDLLNREWNSRHRPFLNMSLCEGFHGVPLQVQAQTMHLADIIVSPHGAQLTNLAFIQPCTAVLELFPRGYYLGFFQPYVLNAGGISLNGYPMDRDPLWDTQQTPSNETVRLQFRNPPIYASSESVAKAFPNVVLQVLHCRRRLRLLRLHGIN